MSIPNSALRQIQPCHPGELLREEFLPEYNLTADELASALQVSPKLIHHLLDEEAGITPLLALQLAYLFGNSPEFWLNAQRELDLWVAHQTHQTILKQIQPISLPDLADVSS